MPRGARPLLAALLLSLGAPLALSRTSGAQQAPPAAHSSGELVTSAGRASWVAPSSSEAARPVTVYLHGMCATGALECPVFEGAADAGFLLCPDGPAPCDGGGKMWAGTATRQAEVVAASLAALRGAFEGRIAEVPMALVGYSLGAPGALSQALRDPGRYDRLMIVNATLEPSAAQLRKAGVKRIAFVAGDRDATAGKLRKAAKALADGGVDARFFSLEATGHYFDGRSASLMRAPLAWLLAPLP